MSSAVERLLGPFYLFFVVIAVELADSGFNKHPFVYLLSLKHYQCCKLLVAFNGTSGRSGELPCLCGSLEYSGGGGMAERRDFTRVQYGAFTLGRRAFAVLSLLYFTGQVYWDVKDVRSFETSGTSLIITQRNILRDLFLQQH